MLSCALLIVHKGYNMAARKKTFEASLNELAQLVDTMERGDLDLEASLNHFERGINLTKTCQTALTEAEQKVQLLIQQGQQEQLDDYSNEDSNDDNT